MDESYFSKVWPYLNKLGSLFAGSSDNLANLHVLENSGLALANGWSGIPFHRFARLDCWAIRSALWVSLRFRPSGANKLPNAPGNRASPAAPEGPLGEKRGGKDAPPWHSTSQVQTAGVDFEAFARPVGVVAEGFWA